MGSDGWRSIFKHMLIELIVAQLCNMTMLANIGSVMA